MKAQKEKAVLVMVENLRVKEYDSLNVILERFEENLHPVTKETIKGWKFKGYFPSIRGALTFAVNKELLIDKNTISDLESYLKQIENSNRIVLQAIERM